ncbi:MAG: DUF429 domain-containing protein [Planctomycetota bacterium]
MHEVLILGVDCATDPRRTGLARARLGRAGLVLEAAALGEDADSNRAHLVDCMDGAERLVLALDAPLGWPRDLGLALASHRAGDPIAAPADLLFRRETDRDLHRRLGKMPLEVGADRIARTARAALELLDALRREGGRALPVACVGEDLAAHRSVAVEVYPAATALVRGWPARGYKRADQRPVRERLLECLTEEMRLACDTDPLLEHPDVLDAALAALGGADFARGACRPPADPELAAVESHIWVRRESTEGPGRG